MGRMPDTLPHPQLFLASNTYLLLNPHIWFSQSAPQGIVTPVKPQPLCANFTFWYYSLVWGDNMHPFIWKTQLQDTC